MPEKKEILARLQKDILSLQGYKPSSFAQDNQIGLGIINHAFPNNLFPLASLHEFLCFTSEELAAAAAFVSGILSSCMHKGGTILWVCSSQKIFPPGLKTFGVQPDQVIFLHLKKEKKAAWAIEEALKCHSVAAVVGEMPEMSFTDSRRFQLAIEKTGVGCFILRSHPKNLVTTAVTRWNIKPLQSKLDDLPGIGHPRWQAKLLKVRNGKPDCWDLEWVNGTFHPVSKLAVLHHKQHKKTG